MTFRAVLNNNSVRVVTKRTALTDVCAVVPQRISKHAMSRRLVSTVVAAIILLIVVVASAVLIYGYLSRGASTVAGSSSEIRGNMAFVRIESVSLSRNGSLEILVGNYGDTTAEINSVYIIDALTKNVVLKYNIGVTIPPGKVIVITLPNSTVNRLEEKGISTIIIKVGGPGGETLSRPIQLVMSRTGGGGGESGGQEAPRLEPVAFRATSKWGLVSWTVINFENNSFILYNNYTNINNVQGPYTGSVMVVRNSSSYRLPDYADFPAVIVYNPTKGSRDWVFTLENVGGRNYSFLLQRLTGNITEDVLVFWADLSGQYLLHNIPSGNFRSEVVRITLYSDGTYRIASYYAAGAFKHEFFIDVSKPSPLEGVLVYTKDFGEGWSYAIWCNGTGCFIEQKVFIVTP